MSKIKKVSKEELELLSHKDCVRFALFCAEQVKDSWKDIPECVVAIETAERWLEGKASAEECKVAAYAADAHAAAHAAAHATDDASHAAAYATYAAYAYAAYAAAAYAYAAYYATSAAAYKKPHLIKAQRNRYNELLHFDDIAEKLLLGETV